MEGEAQTTDTGAELAVPAELLNVQTGEILPATVENAAAVLEAARAMKLQLNEVIAGATAFLAEQSRTLGTKSFPSSYGKVELRGGEEVSYDPQLLMEALREADCPEPIIGEVVLETVSYKVDRSRLKRLTGANPDYQAAAELAEVRTPKAFSASVKRTT